MSLPKIISTIAVAIVLSVPGFSQGIRGERHGGTGSGAATNPTATVVPKNNGGTFGDSSIADNGTQVTISEPVQQTGVNGGFDSVEGTGAGLSFQLGHDYLYPYSTLHCWAETLNSITQLNECLVAANGTWTAGDLLKVGPNTFDAQDAGIVAANVATASGTLTSGNIVQGGGGKALSDSGIVAANVITKTGSPASGNLAKFSGTGTVTNADLTGDVTTSGGVATTLATVNAGPGTCGDSTHSCQITTNGKGLVTSQTAVAISGTGASTAPLNLQGTLTPVTGTGAVANVYTFSIPGNTIPATGCVSIIAGFKHTTGTASVQYSWSWNGGNLFGGSLFASTSTAMGNAQLQICNNGATNSQLVWASNEIVGSSPFAGNLSNSSADTTTAQTVSFTFNVASTDAVTPEFWVVKPF